MTREQDKALVAYRLDRARTALSDAKTLIETGKSTMSIVNRSYYAMFYAVLALLQTIGKTPSKHSGVVNHRFAARFGFRWRLPLPRGV